MSVLRFVLVAPLVVVIAIGLLMAYAAWSVADFVLMVCDSDT